MQPQCNENLGISISFDGDLIFLGDAYKNIKVLQLKDPEELKEKEKLEDAEKYISIKRLCSNKMNEKVVGVYTMRAAPRNDKEKLSMIEKKAISVFSFAESGYIRLYALRERRLLECIA